jgi:hypothetical protein
MAARSYLAVCSLSIMHTYFDASFLGSATTEFLVLGFDDPRALVWSQAPTFSLRMTRLLTRFVSRLAYTLANFLYTCQQCVKVLGLYFQAVIRLGQLLLQHFGHAAVQGGGG